MARLDYEIARWAKANLDPVELDGERIDPQDAAREVIQGEGQYEWIEDRLDTSASFAPKLTNEDIIKLREARSILALDIAYLGAVLPSHGEFPESRLLLQLHQDLGQFEKLKDQVAAGRVPDLTDSSPQTIAEASALLADIEALQVKRDEVANARRPWTVSVFNQMVQDQNAEFFQMLEALGRELGQEKDLQKDFLRRPVDIPAGFEADSELVAAVANLAEEQSPFGVMGVFGKSAQRQMLKRVRVRRRLTFRRPKTGVMSGTSWTTGGCCDSWLFGGTPWHMREDSMYFRGQSPSTDWQR